MNIAYHELMNGSRLDDRSEPATSTRCARSSWRASRTAASSSAADRRRTSTSRAQPTLWEVYGIPKGGNDYFIQITTDSVVWGGLSGATPAEAVSWGKVNPGVLPDTVVAYCDSTIAFPLFCEYAVGSAERTPSSARSSSTSASGWSRDLTRGSQGGSCEKR